MGALGATIGQARLESAEQLRHLLVREHLGILDPHDAGLPRGKQPLMGVIAKEPPDEFIGSRGGIKETGVSAVSDDALRDAVARDGVLDAAAPAARRAHEHEGKATRRI